MDFKSLPVYRHKESIIDALQKSQVIIVESPTGSGKTTQIPLILKEAGYDKAGIIGITQPRRIATLSICEFIKKQIKDEGAYCAYTMRFSDTSTPETRIKIMTDGILLQEIKDDHLMSRYSVLMVDEAHERSLNIDFILGLVKEVISERKDLKVIISSATINTKTFSEFFDGAPIISIDSKPYPVDVQYIPALLTRDNEEEYYQKIVDICRKAHEDENGGDVLVFLPGEAEIKACMTALYLSPIASNLELYPLYGRLSKEEQEEVFTPTSPGKTKVVVSTNIAETSITIDGIRTVIDSGMAKVNFYNQRNFTSSLLPVPISRASADQRKGRAGRTAPGVCYRLYSLENFERRSEFTEEEILHSDLAEVVLRMSELEIYNTETFPFITPPKKDALKSAEETLILIGAIERDHRLTSIGEMMIKFPLLPRLSRVIVEAILNYPSVLSNVITSVAYLSTKSPFILPPGEELQARDVHHTMGDKIYGDFVAQLTLYRKYTAISGKKEREAFCKNHYLDWQTMEEIVHIKYQLEDIVCSMGVPVLEGGSVSEYFSCLVSGLRQYVCRKIDRFSFRSAFADKIHIHPGSAWFKNVPDYILAGEIVQTTKMYARTVSPLRYEWIAAVDQDLIRALSEKGFRNKEREAKVASNELESFRVSDGKKDRYIVPLGYAGRLKGRSDTKIYLSLGKYISKNSIKTNRLDKEFRLIPMVKGPLSEKPRGAVSIAKKEYRELAHYMDYIFKPFVTGNREFSFLALKDCGGEKYSLLPMPSIGSACKETMFALASIIDGLPKKEQKLRQRAELLLLKIENALDFDI